MSLPCQVCGGKTRRVTDYGVNHHDGFVRRVECTECGEPQSTIELPYDGKEGRKKGALGLLNAIGLGFMAEPY